MPRLLVVHHTTSPALQAMLEAAVAGARDPELDGVEVVLAPALAAGVPDVLAADGYLLGTPANIGYMSGALKHFFDQIYYPCLTARKGAPFGLYVHGASDTTGAVRAVAAITTGLGWSEVSKPVTVTGPVGTDAERQCYELGATVAANLLLAAGGDDHGRASDHRRIPAGGHTATDSGRRNARPVRWPGTGRAAYSRRGPTPEATGPSWGRA